MWALTPCRIDLLTDLTGVAFEDAWRNRTNLPFEGISIPFLSREDLLRNKRATGRAQDLADTEALGEKPEKGE